MNWPEKFLLPLALAGLAALAPIHALIVTTGFLIFSDTFLGVWAAMKRGEKISSGRLRDMVTKMLVYQTVIITGFFVQTHMVPEIPFTKLAAAAIAFVEIKSLYENASVILGKPLFSEIIDRLGSKNRN